MEIQGNSKSYVVQLPNYRRKLNYRQAMKFNFVTHHHRVGAVITLVFLKNKMYSPCTNFILNTNISKHKILVSVGHTSMYQSILLYFLPPKFDYFLLDKKTDFYTIRMCVMIIIFCLLAQWCYVL